jgi:hypothetical protein
VGVVDGLSEAGEDHGHEREDVAGVHHQSADVAGSGRGLFDQLRAWKGVTRRSEGSPKGVTRGSRGGQPTLLLAWRGVKAGLGNCHI